VEREPSRARSQHLRAVLVVLTLLTAAVVAGQEPVKVQAAQRSFNEAYRQGDWAKAVEIGSELVAMLPGRPLLEYNLACVYALSGDADEALDILGRAAASGFRDLSHLDADHDLDPVRDLPGFNAVRSQVESNQRRFSLEARAAAAGTPILIVTPKGHDPDRPAPLIVALHGYGDRPENHPGVWVPAANDFGAILAVPQGGRQVGGGFGWTGVEEVEAVLERVLAEVSGRFTVDRSRIVLAGFSQGAYLAMALGVRHPELLAGVIPMAGAYIPEIDAPPPAEGREPRYYFMAGSQDRAVTDMRRAAKDYRAAGYAATLRILPGIGHASPDPAGGELSTALRWVLGR
jgi:phospholipase/carboxylesterase